MTCRTTRWLTTALLLVCLFASAESASAYIGPGAGFALVSSAFVLLTTVVVVLFSLLAWPFRALWRVLTMPAPPKATITRLIVIGLDGQDPTLTDQFMREGILPNFSALAEAGSYRRLKTTFPSVSPVAWSSFSTGAHPARHNIFDFLDRDRRTYLPMLSSTRIGKVDRFLTIGRYRIPLRKPELRLLRKSKPFWTILGEHRIWSTILRVPITFPPDKFYGAELSAMSVPDLLGTQGTFLLYTTRPPGAAFKEGGLRHQLSIVDDRVETSLHGPDNMFVAGNPPLTLPLRLRLDRVGHQAHVILGSEEITLKAGALSAWIPLAFSAMPGVTVKGITRLLVTEMGEHFSLYVAPLNLDPETPAMPISHPSYYATYLAKKVGAFATLGLAEDTWALNEGVTDDGTFLQQTYDIDREREAMFFASLDRLRRGSLVCVFDATDRIQHMFWRDIVPGHPAGRGREQAPHRHAIRDLYRHNDAMIGRVRQQLRDGDVLMVISDHGFSSFRRGVNLNQWLLREGYLALKPGIGFLEIGGHGVELIGQRFEFVAAAHHDLLVKVAGANLRRTGLQGADRLHHAPRQDEAGEHCDRQGGEQDDKGAVQGFQQRFKRLRTRHLDHHQPVQRRDACERGQHRLAVTVERFDVPHLGFRARCACRQYLRLLGPIELLQHQADVRMRD